MAYPCSVKDRELAKFRECPEGSGEVVVATQQCGAIEISGVSPEKFSYRIIDLINGGTKNMNVNGAITPVIFRYTPGPTERVLVDSLDFYLSDGGNPSENNFGALPALPNGLQINTSVAGNVTEFYNLKINLDIYLGFTIEPERTKFLSDKNIVAYRDFPASIQLSGITGDYFEAIVRDDLTGLNSLRMSLLVRNDTSI